MLRSGLLNCKKNSNNQDEKNCSKLNRKGDQKSSGKICKVVNFNTLVLIIHYNLLLLLSTSLRVYIRNISLILNNTSLFFP